MARAHLFGLVVGACAVSAASAAAEPKPLARPHRWEVSGMVGAHLFSETVELGVPDTIETAHPESSPLLGVRAMVRFRKDFGVEAELAVAPTRASVSQRDITVFGWRLHIVVPLGYRFWRFESQLVAGAGGLSTTGTGVHADPDEVASDTDLLFHWGVTGRIKLSPDLHIRGDARHLLPPSTDFSFPFTNNFEFAAGIAYRFGGGPAPVAPEPTGDRDRDSIADDADRCPDQAEDRDGFQDADGCADPDNDGDGIRDPDDWCPLEPETVNDHQDRDGCADEKPPEEVEEAPDDVAPGEPDDNEGSEGSGI